MDTVDFITFVHPGDVNRVYAGDWLRRMVESHCYPFETLRLIKQRLRGRPIHDPNIVMEIAESEDHPDILEKFGLPEVDEKAEEMTHGPNAPHYWKWHNINHLIGLTVSNADYIVFSDSDCTIKSSDPERNWIRAGIEILKRYPMTILIVGPGDGATMAEAQTQEGYRLTQNVSQQLFLCARERMLEVDFNIPWDWEFTAPGGPFQEYYYLLEGRMWRYMHKHGMYRCILPDDIARYWHWNRLTDEGLFETDASKYV